MANIQLPYEMNSDYLAGRGPMPGAPVVIAGAPASSAGSGSSGTGVQDTTPTEGTTPQPNQTVGEIQKTGNLQERLFQPLQRGLGAAQEQTQALRTAFDTKAGPSRTWEGIGGQQQLETAIKAGGTGAEGILGASYGGPQGLSAEDTASLSDAFARVNTRVGAYRNPGQLQQYVQQSTGVTPGMARYDAAILAADTPFQDSVSALETANKASTEALAKQKQETSAFAQQRSKEEADIAKQAQTYLSGQSGDIMTQLTQRVAAENQKRQQLEAARSAALDTGDISALQGLDPSMLSFDPSALNTDRDKLAAEAQAQRDAIMNDPRFASIKDIPVMTLAINNHGNERKAFDADWYDANRKQYTQDEFRQIRKLAEARQDALRDAGFAFKDKDKTHTYVASDPERKGQEKAAKYSEINPLYFGTPWEQTQETEFLGPITGTQAYENNMATPEEMARYNAIMNMLGGNGMEQGLAYEAPVLGYDMSGFQQQEENQAEARRMAMAQAQTDWARFVNKARDKYKDSVKASRAHAVSNMDLLQVGKHQLGDFAGKGTDKQGRVGGIDPPGKTAATYEKPPKKEKK